MHHLEAEVAPAGTSQGFGHERLSYLSLSRLFAFSFGNGVLLSSYFIVTLPVESKRISSTQGALILGAFVAVAGVTQLVCPIVGLVSDRCVHSWGKRRPFIFYGGIVGILGLFCQWIARTEEAWWLYVFAFTVSMLALNVIYSSMNGLIADFVPEAQVGQTNGIIAMLSVLGAVSSFLAFQMMGDLYLYYIVTIFITTSTTFFEAGILRPLRHSGSGDVEERENLVDAIDARRPQKVTLNDILMAFTISPVEHRDFFLILVSRTLYYMGISSQAYLMYFIRDIIRDPVPLDDVEAEKFTAVLAVIGQLCGVLTAFPAGYLSDTLKNGRKKYIYASCAVLALSNLALTSCSTKASVTAVTCLLGAANGIYLTMDGSLAIDALPSKEEAARFLGIWGVGAFIGTSLGPLIGGPVLLYHPNETGDGYTLQGYTILLTLSAVYLGASAYTLKSTKVQ